MITLEAVDTSFNDAPGTGKITMVKENGAWMINKEDYGSKME